jgi:hypothetical protein
METIDPAAGFEGLLLTKGKYSYFFFANAMRRVDRSIASRSSGVKGRWMAGGS